MPLGSKPLGSKQLGSRRHARPASQDSRGRTHVCLDKAQQGAVQLRQQAAAAALGQHRQQLISLQLQWLR